MQAAAILGPGNVSRSMLAFQRATRVQWTSLIEQADVAVIFGGDGTIHRHLQTLVELDIPVLLVPCGSGNDFARALGIRNVRDAVQAFRSFAAGDGAYNIDLGVIRATSGEAAGTNKYFCCVAGVGIDTAIAQRANVQPQWLRSHGGYALTTLREFLTFKPVRTGVSSNDIDAASRPTILVAVANAPTYGGGMKIAPRAKLDDGRLDVCVVRAMNTLKLFCLFPTVYFGRHLGFREVEYTQTPALKIECEFPADVYADGEYVCQTPVEFSIASGALQVVASASAGLTSKCYTTNNLWQKMDARASGSGL
jgi:diacylglycerol kinase (ATP)